jgi:hypothetical protein
MHFGLLRVFFQKRRIGQMPILFGLVLLRA